jgi:hypothetical protein
MVGLVEKAASVTLVRSRNKIDQAFINDEEQGRGRCFQTVGVNFPELWELDKVDHNRLSCPTIFGRSDVRTVLKPLEAVLASR